MSGKPQPLPPEALYTTCDPAQFPFRTTADLEPLEEIVGQDRAVEAVRFFIGMRNSSYNLFALGPEGTGKSTLVGRFLKKHAAQEPVPSDWCYVNNFTEPHRPQALRLPPGRASPLRADMARLVDELKATIPAVFESDEYRNRKSVIEEEFQERQEEAFSGLRQRAQKHDVTLVRTPVGFALAPTRDDEVLSPQEFNELSKKEQQRRRTAMEELQQDMEVILLELPKVEKEKRQRIRDLDREVTMYSLGHLIDELKKEWADLPAVLEYLDAVRRDVVENVDDFLSHEPHGILSLLDPGVRLAPGGAASFRRYQVNVLVDHGRPGPEPGEEEAAEKPWEGAPVVYEDHPTQPNLVGRIEHLSQLGTLVTDFNLIKAGALHRANGGYLILDARKLLMQPFTWETLMRTLQARRIRIESPAESYGLTSTVTLEPQPIPLDVKVVLLGEPILYYLLCHYDPDFRELFKAAADFDTRMDRTPDTALQYARLIGTLAERENLKPMDGGAIARVVEHGARLADDAEKLTTHMASIVDLVREADYWAGKADAETVEAAHVQKAIDAKIYRSDRLRRHIQEEIQRGTLVIETEGEKTGQVNGLSVVQLGDFTFGRPSRISCRVRLGKGEVVDIEREVELGGPLHTKGVLILASYLSARFSREKPLSLSASLVFEQSYGGVEGDSASSAELFALLSALAGIPVKQSLAVTGSVDQNGRVQAIGGVNEKIEGFFDVCSARGLTGDQGVLIPAANVKHLMLRGDVVEAVRQNMFRIFAVETADEGIEILTGVEAGEADEKGDYPIGSVNHAVGTRLDRFVQKALAYAAVEGIGRRPPARKERKR